jgi:hypothetical protein
MKEYNHKQFMDWLNGYEKAKKESLVDDKLLVEGRLSKYWKTRAKRRAIKAERQWPNKQDRDWALKEQDKSWKINQKVYALFEEELLNSEQVTDDVKKMMQKMKKKREEYKKKREAMKLEKKSKFVHPNKKPKGSISKPPPPHRKGEGVGEYYRKAAKKMGGIGAAPGEAIGGMVGENKNENK